MISNYECGLSMKWYLQANLCGTLRFPHEHFYLLNKSLKKALSCCMRLMTNAW